MSSVAGDTRLLNGFEEEGEVGAWQKRDAVTRRVERHASQGRAALEIVLQPTKYPGIALEPGSPLLKGWDRFEFLRLDLFNADPAPLAFTVRLDDAASRGYGSRFNDEFLLRPGWNHLDYAVRNLRTADKTRALDPARLTRLLLFANEPGRAWTLDLDNVRLETTPATAGAAGVGAYDFGPAGSAVMPGFQPVSAADRYTRERGHGWTSTGPRQEYDNELPDSLGRDCVSGSPDGRYTNWFAIDLPNGEYAVTVCGQSLAADLAFVPARSYAIRVEGRTAVEVRIGSEEFYSARYLFRGIDHNWWPGKDVWTEEIRDRLPEHSFQVTVTDGKLNLEFDTLAVYWLAVQPLTTRAEKVPGLAPRSQPAAVGTTGLHAPPSSGRNEHQSVPARRAVEAGGPPPRSGVAQGSTEPDEEPAGHRPAWRERVRAEQQREFRERSFYLEPYRPPANPARVSLHLARGEETTVFLNAAAVPEVSGLAALQPVIRAVRLMERPRSRGVYGIEPTVLVPPARCPHASRFAVTLRGEEPGTYRGRIGPVEVTTKVWPLTLPAAADLDVTIGWYYLEGGSLNYFRELFPERADFLRELRDRELRDMVAHGANSLLLEAPGCRPDGSLDSAAADDLLAAGRRAGLVGQRPVLMTTLWLARRVAQQLGVAEFSPQFQEVFPRVLANLRRWAAARGVTLVANVVDEPREEALNPWNRNFADTKRFLEFYRAAGVPSLVTLTGDESFGKDYGPLVGMMDVVAAQPTARSRRLIEAARRAGKDLWFYNAGMTRLSYGFQPWATRAKGRWEWHYQWWQQAYDPFARVDESPWSPGWGAVRPSPDGPVPTEAYERVLAGVDDYRFVFRLEQLLKGRTDAQAVAARQYLEGIRGRVPQFLGEGRDVGEATLDEWRGRIAGFIVALEAEAR